MCFLLSSSSLCLGGAENPNSGCHDRECAANEGGKAEETNTHENKVKKKIKKTHNKPEEQKEKDQEEQKDDTEEELDNGGNEPADEKVASPLIHICPISVARMWRQRKLRPLFSVENRWLRRSRLQPLPELESPKGRLSLRRGLLRLQAASGWRVEALGPLPCPGVSASSRETFLSRPPGQRGFDL